MFWKFFTWLRPSFEENGKASGKALSAFVLVVLFLFMAVMATLCPITHTAPEFIIWATVTMILGLYGVKAVSQVYGKPVQQRPAEEKKDPEKQNETDV